MILSSKLLVVLAVISVCGIICRIDRHAHPFLWAGAGVGDLVVMALRGLTYLVAYLGLVAFSLAVGPWLMRAEVARFFREWKEIFGSFRRKPA